MQLLAIEPHPEDQMMIAFVKWSFDPVFVRLGPLTIRWYGVVFMLAFVMAIVILNWIYRVERKPRDDVGVLMLFLMIGTIMGARLGHCFFYNPLRYIREPLSILKTWKGGLSSHGGTIGIGVALFLYSRFHRDQKFIWLCDRCMLPAALGACFVRIGNFLNSEIRGIPTQVPWGVRFLVDSPRARSPVLIFEPYARHPVQLYEAFAYACIFIALLLIYRKLRDKTPRALLSGVFMTGAFAARFVLEFFKVKQARYAVDLPLTVGQLLSIPAMLLGIAAFVVAWRNRGTVGLAPEADKTGDG